MAAMAYSVSMDRGCGGHLLYTSMKLVRTSAERSKGETCLTRGCYPPRDLGVQFGALKEYFLVQRVYSARNNLDGYLRMLSDAAQQLHNFGAFMNAAADLAVRYSDATQML